MPSRVIPSASTGFPPRHAPFVLASVTGGARRDDAAAERDAGGALGTYPVAASGVRSRAAGRVGVLVGAVHDGEAIGALVTHFQHVLRYGHPLARDLQHRAVHATTQDGIPSAVAQRCFTFVLALRREPHPRPPQYLFHSVEIRCLGPESL